MPKLPICVYQADTPDGRKAYVSCLPPELGFSRGLPPETIIGVLLRPLEEGEAITPAVFARNQVFVDFMHRVIARFGPDQPGFIAEAKRQGEGWVYIIDQRTPTPQGAVPSEDIIGAFEVKGGLVVPGSYHPGSRHMILSKDGFFQLGSDLQACLLGELGIAPSESAPERS